MFEHGQTAALRGCRSAAIHAEARTSEVDSPGAFLRSFSIAAAAKLFLLRLDITLDV